MKPRLIILIAIGIFIYFSLSVYHMRQVEKYPVNSAQEKEQADWIQITTADNKKSSGQTLPGIDRRKKEPIAQQTAQDAKFDLLRQQIQTTGEEKEKLRKRVAQKESDNKNLLLQLESLRGRITRQQEKSQEVNAKLHLTQQALEEQLQKQKITANEIDALKGSLDSKAEAITKENKRTEALSLRAEQSTADLAEAHKTITRMQTTLAAFRSENEKSSVKQQRYIDELSRAKKENKVLLVETGDLYKQLDALKSRLTMTETSLNKARLKAEAMFRYGQEQNSKLSPSAQEIERLQARVEQQGDLLEKSKQQLKVQQEKIEKLIGLQVVKTEENSKALRKAAQETEELSGQLRDNAALLKQKESILLAMKTSLDETNTKMKAGEKKSADRATEITSLQQSLTILSDEKKQLQTKLNQATGKQTVLVADKDKYQAQAKKISQELQKRNDQLNTLQEQLKKLQVNLIQKEADLKKISSQIKQAVKATRQLEKIQKELQQKNKTLTAAEKKISRITREHKKVTNRLIKSKSTLKKLETSLEQAKKENGSNTSLLGKQSAQIKQFKEEVEARDTIITKLTDDISRSGDALQKVTLELVKLQQNNKNATALKPEPEEKTASLNQTGEELRLAREETKALQTELDRREKAFFALRDKFYELQTEYESLKKGQDEITNPPE